MTSVVGHWRHVALSTHRNRWTWVHQKQLLADLTSTSCCTHNLARTVCSWWTADRPVHFKQIVSNHTSVNAWSIPSGYLLAMYEKSLLPAELGPIDSLLDESSARNQFSHHRVNANQDYALFQQVYQIHKWRYCMVWCVNGTVEEVSTSYTKMCNFPMTGERFYSGRRRQRNDCPSSAQGL